VLPSQPQAVTQIHGAGVHLHVRHALSKRVACAREAEPHIGALPGDLRYGPDQGQRIEPIPDAATPQEHPVRRRDAGKSALEHSPRVNGGLRGEAVWHHVDQ